MREGHSSTRSAPIGTAGCCRRNSATFRGGSVHGLGSLADARLERSRTEHGHEVCAAERGEFGFRLFELRHGFREGRLERNGIEHDGLGGEALEERGLYEGVQAISADGDGMSRRDPSRALRPPQA